MLLGDQLSVDFGWTATPVGPDLGYPGQGQNHLPLHLPSRSSGCRSTPTGNGQADGLQELSSHATLSGVGQGGCLQASSGARREPLGASPDVGPSWTGWESAPAPKCPPLLAATDSQVLMGM